MVKRLILFVFMLLISIPVFAEAVDTAWVRRYNGPADTADEAYAIAVDDSGNVYVTGVGDGTGTSSDYATIKYHSNGDTAWVRRYNGPGNSYDGASDIAVDDSGNVYVSGGSWGSGTSTDYTTIKYYSTGDTAWVRRYNGLGNAYDGASDMAIDDSGNVYVTGKSYGTGTDYDYATIKYKPDADTAWVRRYNGPADSTDGANAIAVDDSGNVYVSGYSWGNGTSADYTTIKYHPNGDTAWLRRYDGPANGDDRASAIAVDDSGNVYVTGYSDSTGSSQDYATIKYDSSGNELWVKRFNCANGTDKPAAIAVDSSNNIYVTGRSGCGGVTAFDYVTIKYYPNGDTAWLRKYQGPVEQGYDYAYALAVDSAGNVYVTGTSQGSGTDYDYCTIKYVQTGTDVKDEAGSEEKPSEFGLSQNYPNPFNPATTIRYAVHGSQFTVHNPIHTTLTIYNILGQKVRTLLDEYKVLGEYQVIWDGKDDSGEKVGSGIYFYRLKIGDFSEAKRSVLLK